MSVLLRLLLVPLVVVALGCRPKGPELGEIERLNGETGNVGRYQVAYYASIYALPNGGAVAAWMREEPPYRPVVFRQAPEALQPFGPEAYLSPDSMLKTITIGLTMLPGPSGGEFYAAWQARKPETGDKFIVFRSTRDGGATWAEPRQLNTEPMAFAPSIATDRHGGVTVAWPDERGYTTGIFANTSFDRGATWLPQEVRIDGGEGGGFMANAVSVASDGEKRVIAAWEEQGGKAGRVVMVALSNDRGATWAPPVRVDDGRGRGAPLAPRAAFAGDRAVVLWTAAVSGVNAFAEVWADSSVDGAHWGEDVLLHEQPGGAAPIAQLYSDGERAAAVFEAAARGGSESVFFVRLEKDGSWTPGKDALAPLTPPSVKAGAPRLVAAADGTLFLVYAEDGRSVRLLRSRDDGATWEPPVLVVERPGGEGQPTVRFPQVTVGGRTAYVMWEEWGDARAVIKTLGDAQTKRPPLDLYVRRIAFH
ncbi:MAG: hypothetical protein B6D46_11990 [Polyangiaceae bacterium UTPRO1]|jgi:hypothetical protein|nr:sialidase family protein [Myxococcales bacterium]OQY65944.1 MAG: hypothetical protein B6D46_11990 [Polyangiaceae bacterium UTPRO1]